MDLIDMTRTFQENLQTIERQLQQFQLRNQELEEKQQLLTETQQRLQDQQRGNNNSYKTVKKGKEIFIINSKSQSLLFKKHSKLMLLFNNKFNSYKSGLKGIPPMSVKFIHLPILLRYSSHTTPVSGSFSL